MVADCGSATTRVALLDLVEGRYRFIANGQAPSTGAHPLSDITVGMINAVADVEAATGREIVGEQGQLLIPSQGGTRGVDRFVATTSAAQPLRTVLVGLADQLSLASARRVALSTYTTIEEEFSPADGRSDSERVQELVALEPDVFLIAGGTSGGAATNVIHLVETVSLAISLQDKGSDPPTVIYAGNPVLRPMVAEILGGVGLRAVENVRPDVDAEYLDSAQAELDLLYEKGKLGALPGAEQLRNLANGALIPTAKAFGWSVQYLGAILGNNVVGVDVGSASVTMGAVLNGISHLAVRSDLGIGHNLPKLLEQVDSQQVMRWLPHEMADSDLKDFVANKALFPQTVPVTSEELHLELALARELIRSTLPVAFPSHFDATPTGTLPPVEMILLGGTLLGSVPRPGQAALALLDALQPVGLCMLALDTHGLAPALGAVAGVVPLAAVQVIESGAFRELGGVVAPVGQAKPGEQILRLKMIRENGSELETEVEAGSLKVLPLQPGHRAELQLRPLKRFDVGEGPGRSCRRSVFGGAVGLIVDARGRPLRLPTDPAERRAKTRQWLWDVGGLPV